MKVLMYFFGIIIFAGAVGLNVGCKEKNPTPPSQAQSAQLKEKEPTPPPQRQSVQQKEPGEATDTPGLVAVSAEQAKPLSVGAKVPAVSLKTLDGQTADLADLIEEKPTVIVFYRGGWCPYCNTQLGRLKEIEQQILDTGWQIIAISPDRPQKLSESIIKHQMKYTLFSDSKMEASKKFGIAFKVDDATIEKYKGYGIDLDDASGENHHLLPIPAVFLIGADGIIKFTYANPDYKVRLDPQVLLSTVKAEL